MKILTISPFIVLVILLCFVNFNGQNLDIRVIFIKFKEGTTNQFA